GVPLTITRTRCVLGAQVRRVLRLEWLTLLPYFTPLPQTSQNFPISMTPPSRLMHSQVIKQHNYSTARAKTQVLFHVKLRKTGQNDTCTEKFLRKGRPWERV